MAWKHTSCIIVQDVTTLKKIRGRRRRKQATNSLTNLPATKQLADRSPSKREDETVRERVRESERERE